MSLRCVRRTACCYWLWMALPLAPALAQSPSDAFYKAYYLETEQGDVAAAAKLYAQAAESPSAPAELRAEAQRRLAACREEAASAEFIELMPPETIAYIEIGRPGEQVRELLGMLGLLADPARPASDAGRQVAVSPTLIKELLGIRGAAIGLTGFDFASETPMGVAVFHPGNLEIIRGLIETGLPAAGRRVEDIEGYPTYDIEGEVLVCLTARMVVISRQPDQIRGVLRRINDSNTPSLADNEALAEAFKYRKDALLFVGVDAKALMQMARPLLVNDPEFAQVQALLDPESLRWFAARAGISPEGLVFDVAVRFDAGHHNLAYNLVRTPPITRETLRCIPQGAAGFLAGALSEPAGSVKAAHGSDRRPPAITGLDLGREIFANVVDFALFAAPPIDGRSSPGPAPDLGLVIRVNDPAKSQALWTQILGIASLAAGSPTAAGAAETVAGAEVRTYTFPEGISVHFAAAGDKLVVSTTRPCLERTLATVQGGPSILDDSVFTASVANLSDTTSKALLVHPGRCLEVARRYMTEADLRDLQPFSGVLTHLVAAVMTHETEEQLQVSAQVTGIPNIGPLVAQVIQHEETRAQAERQLDRSVRAQDWSAALEASDRLIASEPEDFGHLAKRFEILALQKKDRQAAMKCGEQLLKSSTNATAINNLAWALLTDQRYQGEYESLAMRLAERACELSQYQNWALLDTLALARFRAGRIAEAIELQEQAIGRRGGDDPDLRETLQRYQSAARSDQ